MKLILAFLFLLGSNSFGSGLFVNDPTQKTVVMVGQSVTTTTTTANQTVISYVVPVGRTLFIEYFDCNARLTTYAATATNFGDFFLNVPVVANGTYKGNLSGIGQSIQYRVEMPDPINMPYAVPTGQSTVTMTVTPSAATAMNWYCDLLGYLK